MAIDARDDLIVVSEGLLGFDNLFDNNNFGFDVDAVEIVSIDIGGGPQAVGAGVVTSNFDLGVLSVGNVGVAGRCHGQSHGIGSVSYTSCDIQTARACRERAQH